MRAANCFLGLLLTILLVPGASEADTSSTDPALGVARVSYVTGNVTTMRGDSGDWIATTVNMPVVEGDTVRAAGLARAEIQLDQGNFVRLGNNSEIQLLELAAKRFRIRVLQGTAVYSELSDSEADTDIETPFAVVRPMLEGRYAVTVDADEVFIEVREGHAEVAFETNTGQLPSGRVMILRKGDTGVHFETHDLGPADELDKWAANRDKSMRRVVSHQYLSKDIYGAKELDDHGHWRFVDGYGHSWFPNVGSSWAPYRQGRWTWIDYYGWNWVGNEPWGWAPYHWGRWYNHPGHGWGWFPGSPRLRHTWRPALVSFFGAWPTAHGGVVAAAYGGIGWVPLAPGERYVPWYGRRYYVGSPNNTIVVDNSVRIFNNYRNARDANGVSFVDSRDLGSSARQTPRAIRTGELGQVAAIRGPLPVVPYRASQGRIVAASGSDRAAALQNSRRAPVSTLRDGTTRVAFTSQQERVRSSMESFRRGTGSPTAPVAANTRVAEPAARLGTPLPGGTVGSPTARTSSGPATQVRTAGSTSATRVGALSTMRNAQSATATPTAAGAPAEARTRAATSQSAGGGVTTPNQSLRATTAVPASPPAASSPRSASSAVTRVPTARSSSSQRQAGTSTTSPAFMPRARSRLATRSPSPGSLPSASRSTSRSASPSYSSRGRSQSTTRAPSPGSRPSSSGRSATNSRPSYSSGSSTSSRPSYRSRPSYSSGSSSSSRPSYNSGSSSSSRPSSSSGSASRSRPSSSSGSASRSSPSSSSRSSVSSSSRSSSSSSSSSGSSSRSSTSAPSSSRSSSSPNR